MDRNNKKKMKIEKIKTTLELLEKLEQNFEELYSLRLIDDFELGYIENTFKQLKNMLRVKLESLE